MARALSLVVAAGLVAGAASGASSPGGVIVFSSASGVAGKEQIWVMKADGTGRHAVTPPTLDARVPRASADGRRIAFVRHGDIYVIRADGSHLRQLTRGGATASAPAWSSEGLWLAYTSESAGRSSIWKMRADGSRKTRLALGTTLGTPAWSPDGRRIAFAAPNWRIWVMNASGGAKRPLTHGPNGGGVDWAPSWSPDGSRLAYESSVGTGPRRLTNEIWLVNADGSHQVRLTHNALNDDHPSWSPDGRWLVFASEMPGHSVTHLWLMRPNGKGLHRATSWPGEQINPSWAR
jgi:Tol biopolymer transport system component